MEELDPDMLEPEARLHRSACACHGSSAAVSACAFSPYLPPVRYVPPAATRYTPSSWRSHVVPGHSAFGSPLQNTNSPTACGQ